MLLVVSVINGAGDGLDVPNVMGTLRDTPDVGTLPKSYPLWLRDSVLQLWSFQFILIKKCLLKEINIGLS